MQNNLLISSCRHYRIQNHRSKLARPAQRVNQPKDKEGRPVHQAYWFSSNRKRVTAYAQRLYRPVNENNKKDIHFMAALAKEEKTLKISDLFRQHFETLDYKKLSVAYPQGNAGMGAGHVTFQVLKK